MTESPNQMREGTREEENRKRRRNSKFTTQVMQGKNCDSYHKL